MDYKRLQQEILATAAYQFVNDNPDLTPQNKRKIKKLISKKMTYLNTQQQKDVVSFVIDILNIRNENSKFVEEVFGNFNNN